MKHRAGNGVVLGVVLILMVLTAAACQRSKPERVMVPPTSRPGSMAQAGAEAEETPSGEEAVAPGETSATTPITSTAVVTITATPAPTETPGPTPLPFGEAEYVVRSGDTLLDIAIRFKTTTEDIMELNGMTDPDRLRVGQMLRVPYGEPPPDTAGTAEHIVKAGDTLVLLARTYHTSVAEILAVNPALTKTTRLLPDTVVYVPVNTLPNMRVHKVQPGETLSTIAERFGTTSQAIINANGLTNPARVDAGQELIIP